MAMRQSGSNISLFTNFRNNVKAGGFYQLSSKFAIGAGVRWYGQDEFRTVEYQPNSDVGAIQLFNDSLSLKLNEYIINVAASYRVNDKLGVGLAIKHTTQNFSRPVKVFIESGKPSVFTNENYSKTKIDADLSVSYAATESLNLGATLLNVFGSELYSDVFLPGAIEKPLYQQRAVGIGAMYKLDRLNIGTDILLNKEGLYDISLGANYVPFNNALISAGFAFLNSSYSIAFRMKYFRIAYVNDNNFLVNENKKGKSGIFNGRLHSGFVFDF